MPIRSKQLDSVTHIVLGACIGEAFFEKGFGKKAMLWGALAQSLPDIDFLSALWLDIPGSMLAHRGFTHSFAFAVLIVPYLSLIAYHIHRPQGVRLRNWLLFFFVEIAVHLALDSLNAYGIGWFEPFSHERFAFNLIFVADPFFSLIPVLAFFRLLFLHSHSMKRSFWWKAGCLTPLIYILVCFHHKMYIHRLIQKKLPNKELVVSNFQTTPAPLQNFLWYVYAKTDSGFYTGYLNIFHGGNDYKPVFHRQQEKLLNEVHDHESLQKLIRFSQGNYTIDKLNDTLYFQDIRFGQTYGWEDGASPFVFRYALIHGGNSRLHIQRGRMSSLESNHLKSLARRMFTKY